MPRLERLGHVGIHVNDIEKMRDFYINIVGLHLTEDASAERGMVFLTSSPDWEHHELFLVKGRNVPVGSILVHQISFRVPEVVDLQEYLARFKREDTPIDQVVTHGFSLSIYFFDPEGNRVEVYWDTKIRNHKAFARKIDLEQSREAILAETNKIVEEIPALAAVH